MPDDRQSPLPPQSGAENRTELWERVKDAVKDVERQRRHLLKKIDEEEWGDAFIALHNLIEDTGNMHIAQGDHRRLQSSACPTCKLPGAV